MSINFNELQDFNEITNKRETIRKLYAISKFQNLIITTNFAVDYFFNITMNYP